MNNENRFQWKGKTFEAVEVPMGHICQGCYLRRKLCFKMKHPYCYRGVRKDKRNVIFKLLKAPKQTIEKRLISFRKLKEWCGYNYVPKNITGCKKDCEAEDCQRWKELLKAVSK